MANLSKVLKKTTKSPFSKKNKIARLVWGIFYSLFFRLTPHWSLHAYRNFILKMFGAKIGQGSIVYPSAKIFAPWNLEIGYYTCIGPDTDIYNMDKIVIGDNVTISQNSVLCTGSHDISSSSMQLFTKPIIIQDQAWICAYSKVMLGVTISEGAIIGLGSIVTHSTDKWKVYAGNPAKYIKDRVIDHD